jgi:hypothetical protein
MYYVWLKTFNFVYLEVDGSFVKGLGPWLEWYSEWGPHLANGHNKDRNSNAMVKTSPVWSPYIICLVLEDL